MYRWSVLVRGKKRATVHRNMIKSVIGWNGTVRFSWSERRKESYSVRERDKKGYWMECINDPFLLDRMEKGKLQCTGT